MIQDIITEIREIYKMDYDKEFYEKINLLIHITLFEMNLNKSNEFLKNNFFIYQPDFIKLFLLKLKLYLKYEDIFLFLSYRSYDVVRVFILGYLKQLPQSEYVKSTTIEVASLIFSVCSKIYNYEAINDEFFHINLVRKSLLSELNDTFLLHTGNFWKNYFDYKYFISKETATKTKVLKICENMIFYNFFLSKDMEFTCNFIKEYIPIKSVNMFVVRRSVISKLSNVLFSANQPNKKNKNIKKEISYEKKLLKSLFLCQKQGFFNFDDVIKVISLNKTIKDSFLENILTLFLNSTSFEKEKRLFFWLKYIKYKKKRQHYTFHDKLVFEISEEDKEQIHIDMVRTKKSLGEHYQNKLETLTIEFISRYKEGLDYFQGFNYIISFFLKVAPEKKELFELLDFITNNIINVN